LNIDENGEILMEDDTDDEDLDSQAELLLLEEDDWVPVAKTAHLQKKNKGNN
jgi:hypothetical protein